MLELSYAEIQEFLSRLDRGKYPGLKISILRNITVEPIEPYIRYLAWHAGFDAQVKFGEYDNIFQEASGVRPELLEPATDFVFVFLKLENLSWDLARNFNALSKKRIDDEIERVEDYISSVLAGIRKQSSAAVIWLGFELPSHPSLGSLDSQSSGGQLGAIGRLNEFLRESLSSAEQSYFVDLNLCRLRLGDSGFYDRRYWHIGRAPYSRQALREIAQESFKIIRSLKGRSKKCLVLDCDNVLWGGIVGEDGLGGIKLGKDYPGSPFYEFQQEVLNLYNRGIIIALCSRNNEEEVWEVFRKHPHMLLREEHIAAARINWEDKATNIRQLAGDLNIGLDSMVFADDSEFEIQLVRETLPEVETIHLPADRATENRDILTSCNLFDTLSLSREDKKRGAMYKSEASRKKLRAGTTDLTQYLKSLEMVLSFAPADEFTIPRLAQLTQRTNQFNLTTRRHTETDIRNFAKSSSWDVFSVSLQDRFGDSGIIGVVIVKYEPEKASVDTFLLSCRILGRGVEEEVLRRVLERAEEKGCRQVVGEYIPTRKNAQVAEFYQNHGFQRLGKQSAAGGELFVFNLETGPGPVARSFFKEIVVENARERR